VVRQRPAKPLSPVRIRVSPPSDVEGTPRGALSLSRASPGRGRRPAPATAGDCAATRRRACTFGSYGRPPAPSLGPAARPGSSLPRRNPSHSAFSQVATTYRSAPWPGSTRDPSITSETATISAGNCGGGAQAANRAETPGTSRGSESGSVRECAAWDAGRRRGTRGAGVGRGAPAWGGGMRRGCELRTPSRGDTPPRATPAPRPAAISAASPAARPCPGRSA
jgi:hypothetical protein